MKLSHKILEQTTEARLSSEQSQPSTYLKPDTLCRVRRIKQMPEWLDNGQSPGLEVVQGILQHGSDKHDIPPLSLG